jgi:phosphoribosyl 1,2-cyclic phosphodiesterase
MSISLCVLGSGSLGNCTLVTLNGSGGCRHVLIDAGLAPRTTARRLGPLGVSLDEIDLILLTHTDSDHLHAGWIDHRRHRFSWRLHRRHMNTARRAGLRVRELEPFERPFKLGPRSRVTPVPLPHDQLGSTGFLIEHRDTRLLMATDLGQLTTPLRRRLDGLSALAIESNYDPSLERASSRPSFVKERVMGGLGHLSNEQALDAALACAERSNLEHLVLLHLSRQCNDPRLIRRLYAKRAPHLVGRLTLSRQQTPTPLLHVRGGGPPPAPGRQLDFLETLPAPG